jgi:AcrR family transcriptional regulator
VVTTSGNGTRRGRPRSEETRLAILHATSELLLERGLHAVAVEEVVARAGASKATIYRWWPSKELLALDAVYAEWDATRHGECDTGSLRGDLLELIRPWVRLLRRRPFGRVIAAFLAEAQHDPKFAAIYRDRFLEPRRQQARKIFARAVGRGEIPASTDLEVAVDLLYGPLYHRLLHGHADLDDRFAELVIDCVLASITQGAAASATGEDTARGA